MKTAQDIDQRIRDLSARAKLDSWTSFVEEIQVPMDIAPAMVTGRPELIRLATPRDYKAEEVGALLKLIAGLLETNAALREHAEQVAQLTSNWTSAFQTLDTVGRKIGRFAQFRHDDAAAEDEEG